MPATMPAVFRFAPSPNGALHLGHAYSALLNQRLAREAGGELLLRMEDIDTMRCSPALEQAMLEDLHWLGLSWSGPVRRQSAHFDQYAEALQTLRNAELVYPSVMTRGDIKRSVAKKEAGGTVWPADPDGSPLYPGEERQWSQTTCQNIEAKGEVRTWRLDMQKCLDRLDGDLLWEETGRGWDGEHGSISAHPEIWGDVVLARADTPTSYHLSVVVDDALQGITHVVRGRDLFHATSVHRLLQRLLGLPSPLYHHHDLILDDAGRKLSKSDKDTSLQALRAAGRTRQDIVAMVRLS